MQENPLGATVELEQRLNPQIELRHRSATHSDSAHHPEMRPHPLAQYSASAPLSGYWTPPPPYEEVVSSQEDIIQAGSYGFEQSRLDKDIQQKAIPRNSSTPFLSGQQ